MTINEAYDIARAYYDKEAPTEEDFFMYTEALDFLIDSTHDSEYMLDLGSAYYGRKDFEQALKYYEMAAEYGNSVAAECLGYVWYYGRTGTKDYKKAFEYFSRGMELGSPVSTYKVADMYKNGYYVEKDYDKYIEMIEALYSQYRHSNRGPLTDIFTRVARIRIEDGKIDEALYLYDRARRLLERRIAGNRFFGDMNVMKWTIEDIYRHREFDEYDFDLYDLYYVLTKPNKVSFYYDGNVYEVESLIEDGELVIRFEDKWYRTVDDFFKKAMIDGLYLTTIYQELLDFELID